MAFSVRDQMIRIEGGDFAMGSNDFYPDEGPARRVSVDGFWISPHAITNDQFAAFVEATGYVTVAELPRTPACIREPHPRTSSQADSSST